MPDYSTRSEAQAYGDLLDEIALADGLSFRCAWLTEHHFTRHYSHLSKPELVLAAATQRTRRIRLGNAIIPLPFHHPIHVAERVATLDLLSQGRLDVGIGRGFSPREYAAFGAKMGESRALTEESLAILRASFGPGPVTFNGKHYQLDALDVLPRTVQTPHPPLWSASVSPESFEWVAKNGLGMLAGPFKPWFMVKQDIKRFLGAWQGDTPPRIGMTLAIVCLPDAKRAQQLAKPALTWFYRELFKTTEPVLERLYPSYEHFHELGKFRSLLKLGVDLNLLQTFGMAVVGNPEQCIEQLRGFQAAGVTHLLCAPGAGAVSTDHVREIMQCVSEQVVPAFAPAA